MGRPSQRSERFWPPSSQVPICSMDGWQSAGLAPRGHDLDQREKMLLSAAIHLLESSEQPQRPGRPDKFEPFVDVGGKLFRTGSALVQERDWHLEIFGD